VRIKQDRIITYPTSGPLKLTGNVSSLSDVISTSSNTTNCFHNLTFDEICESVRVPVTATVVNTPAPTGAATQDSCVTGTIADFTITGSGLIWYDAATLGNVIPTSTVAVLNTTYFVSQTINGCEGPRFEVLASGPCLGTDDFQIANLSYYPNPVENQLTITAKNEISKVEIYNLIGQQVKVINTNSNLVQIDLSELNGSTYLLKVYSEGNVQNIKVIKK